MEMEFDCKIRCRYFSVIQSDFQCNEEINLFNQSIFFRVVSLWSKSLIMIRTESKNKHHNNMIEDMNQYQFVKQKGIPSRRKANMKGKLEIEIMSWLSKCEEKHENVCEFIKRKGSINQTKGDKPRKDFIET